MKDTLTTQQRISDAINKVFLHQSAGGVILFVFALLAILIANNATLGPIYEHLLHSPVGVVLDKAVYSLSLQHIINDGLMAIFFFLVGLEIKREILQGQLSSPSKALLPVFAAVGGMLFPALIYVYFNIHDSVAVKGWAIPTATDIAFSLGVLSLLRTRVPFSLKVFLTAVAVIDDLGAIIIIALFYTAELNVAMLGYAFLTLCVLTLFNKLNITKGLPYVIGFFVLWVFMLQSGVHATLAGVFTALTVPLFQAEGGKKPLLVDFEKKLHSWVIFIILPTFAFANAGVNFSGVSVASLANAIPLGIMLGLVVGKAIGVTGGVWLAVKCKISSIPEGANWLHVFGIALLCGIGFTVSLFIGNLGFTDPDLINQVKIGVLGGSLIAGLAGYALLRYVARPASIK